MESALYNGFKAQFPDIGRLLCVRHLSQRDETKLTKLTTQLKQSESKGKHARSEILKDIYGNQNGPVLEVGLCESSDVDEFDAKVASLKGRWDSLCAGFHDWFIKKRRQLFIDSVIQSSRENTNVRGLYYTNDIESLHAVEKCIQGYQKKDVITVVQNLRKLSERQELDEIRALYGTGNYKLAVPYKGFFVPSDKWHGWSTARKQDHLKKFREYKPNLSDNFEKPKNSGKKPGFNQRKRQLHTDIEMVIERTSTQPVPVITVPDESEGLRFQDPRYSFIVI